MPSTFTNVSIVISTMKIERGLALQDLIAGAYEFIETLELKPNARVYLLDHLATTEYVAPSFRSKHSLNPC